MVDGMCLMKLDIFQVNQTFNPKYNIMKTPDNKPLGRIFPAIFLSAGFLCSSVSYAATYVWTGDGNNAWGDSTNWDIAGSPDANDDAIYYDNPFSGNAGFAGLNNAGTGSGQRDANSIEFSSNITSDFQINPRGDDGLANDGPDHHLNIKGGGIDVQTASTITLNVDVEAAVNQSWNVIAGGTLIADEQIRLNKITKTGTGTLILRGDNTNSGFNLASPTDLLRERFRLRTIRHWEPASSILRLVEPWISGWTV